MNNAQPPMMPVAKALANQGRMSDSTLVHMNPQEVAGLQSLARQSGTSLTINPQTGLPEAFNLKSILPMVAGAALTPVLGPAAPLVVGGLGALMTGSVEQGLMMGLGAYGGAGLAGSAANLAAPAVAASAPTTAAIAAPGAIGGASGATGLLASGAPVQTLAGATQFAPAASVGGLGFTAPPLPEITSATTAATGSSLVPTASEGFKAVATPALIPDVGTATQATAPFAVSEPISNVIPTTPSSSMPKPSGLGRLFQSDDNVTYENIGSGLKKAFSSGESAMDFLGQNKMNLAMSAAPMLLSAEEEAEIERQRAMIRPYEYQVDNLSGTGVDPFGTEAERLRGRFVAKTPYYAAKGGVVPFAEGGSTSGESSTTTPAPTSNAEANVMARIAAMQQAVGMPTMAPSAGLTALPNMFVLPPAAPRPPVAYTPSTVLDTAEKRYVGTPASDSVVDRSGAGDFISTLPVEDLTSRKYIDYESGPIGPGGTYLQKGRPQGHPSLRNKNKAPEPRRVVGYDIEGRPVYLASGSGGVGFTSGSSNKFSYDPATGTYTQFAEGGSVSGGESSTTTTSAPTQTLTPAQAEVFRNIFAVQQMMGAPVAPTITSAGIGALPNMFTMPIAPVTPAVPVAYTPSVVGTAPALDTSEKKYDVFDPIAAAAAKAKEVETPERRNISDRTAMRMALIGGGGETPQDRIENWNRTWGPGYTRYAGGMFPMIGDSIFMAAEGGSIPNPLNAGGIAGLKKGRFLDDTTDSTGNSDGMSDSMPGVINGEQPARLTDGEFVVPADVVSHLGNGSSKAGAKRLHNMMDRIRKARTGTKKQAPAVKAEKYMPA